VAKAAPWNAADVAVMVGVGFISAVGIVPEETVQQTTRGQGPRGLTLARCHTNKHGFTNRLSAIAECSQFAAKEISIWNPPFCHAKIARLRSRSRKDKRGDVDLISDALPFGRLWVGCGAKSALTKIVRRE
jgi:hypothetical protein